MEKRAYLFLISFFLWATIMLAQDVSGVTNAFKRGSAQELNAFLGDKVEYIYLGDSKTYDKAKTQQVINDFFAANKVSNFAVNHQGNRGESSFIVGTLNTSAGNYRINCFFKKNGDQYLIHQIRIDKSNE